MAERKDDKNLKNEEAEGKVESGENRDAEPDSTVQNETTTEQAEASASSVQEAAAGYSPSDPSLANPLLKSLLVRRPDDSEGPRSMMAHQTMPPPAMPPVVAPPANTPPENSAAAVSENSEAAVSESPKRATKRTGASGELPPSPTKQVKSPKKSPEKKPDA